MKFLQAPASTVHILLGYFKSATLSVVAFILLRSLFVRLCHGDLSLPLGIKLLRMCIIGSEQAFSNTGKPLHSRSAQALRLVSVLVARRDILEGHALVGARFLGQAQYLFGNDIAHYLVGAAGQTNAGREHDRLLEVGVLFGQ